MPTSNIYLSIDLFLSLSLLHSRSVGDGILMLRGDAVALPAENYSCVLGQPSKPEGAWIPFLELPRGATILISRKNGLFE